MLSFDSLDDIKKMATGDISVQVYEIKIHLQLKTLRCAAEFEPTEVSAVQFTNKQKC